nr:hypothetical protein [Tanacetum cinerariifolium]
MALTPVKTTENKIQLLTVYEFTQRFVYVFKHVMLLRQKQNIRLLREKGVMLSRPQHAGYGNQNTKSYNHVSRHNNASITLKKFDYVDAQGQSKGEFTRQRVIDSGCSRHMTGNMSFPTYYKEIDGGYVAFGGNPKGGKITGKGKFDGKADEGFFVGYSLNSKAFRVFNSRTKIMKENLHVRFSENTPNNVGEEDRTNSTNRVNTVTLNINAVSSSRVNAIGTNISIDLPPDPNMPSLEDISIFKDSHDDEDVFDEEADFHNLDSTFQVSPIPTTRIHKDHTLEQVNGDLHSAPQTRRMLKNLEEHGLMSSMGELTFILGLQVKQKKEGIFICQDKYVAEILKKFGFLNVKKASTSMETSKPLLKDEDGEEVDIHMYKSMIGSLMYLTLSMSDIMFAVKGLKTEQKRASLGSFSSRVLNIQDEGEVVNISLAVAYTDSDYAGESLDRKSTTGGCQFLWCRQISW